MGTPALRLVRSSTHCSHNHGLEFVGRSLRPYLHPDTAAQWHDRRGRRDRARGQELRGATTRGLPRNYRQGGSREGVCKLLESHRSPELRGQHGGKDRRKQIIGAWIPFHNFDVIELLGGDGNI